MDCRRAMDATPAVRDALFMVCRRSRMDQKQNTVSLRALRVKTDCIHPDRTTMPKNKGTVGRNAVASLFSPCDAVLGVMVEWRRLFDVIRSAPYISLRATFVVQCVAIYRRIAVSTLEGRQNALHAGVACRKTDTNALNCVVLLAHTAFGCAPNSPCIP